MKFLVLFTFVLSMNAEATGGFSCEGKKGNGEDVEIFGTTGRVPGSPLVSHVTLIEGAGILILPKSQVVGYWNIGSKFLMAITDTNAEKIIVKLIAKDRPKLPEMEGNLELPSGEVIKVDCIND